jgi:hypothetical protein
MTWIRNQKIKYQYISGNLSKELHKELLAFLKNER